MREKNWSKRFLDTFKGYAFSAGAVVLGSLELQEMYYFLLQFLLQTYNF